MDSSPCISLSTFPVPSRDTSATSLTNFQTLSEPMFGWLDHDAEHRRYDTAKAERQNQIESAKQNLRLAMVELEAACQDDVAALPDDYEFCTSSEFRMLLKELNIKMPVGMQLKIQWIKLKKNIKKIVNAK